MPETVLRDYSEFDQSAGLHRLSRFAARILDAPEAIVAMSDAPGEPILLHTWAGIGEAAARSRSAMLGPLLDGTNAPLAVDDAASDSRLGALTGGCLAAALPGDADGPVGYIAVFDPEPRSWSREQVDTIVDLAGAALERRMLNRALAALSKVHTSASRLGRVVERAAHEVFMFDADSLLFLEVNRGARENLGYSIDELRRMTPLDIKPEFTKAEFDELLTPLRTGATPSIQFETVHRRRDGSDYPSTIRLELHDEPDGGTFVAFVKDITDQVALSREAQSVTARLAAILETATGGIVGLDRAGRICVANPAARHIVGRLADPLPFAWPPDISFLDGEDLKPLDASADPVNRAMAGQKIGGEITVMTRPGSVQPRYVRFSSAPVPDIQGTDLHTVVILDDVTEQELNRQKLERAGRLEALGQLTGGVAHDFNNLLATIDYAVQLAMPQVVEAGQRHLAAAKTSVRRGAALTNRLLAFARRQPGMARSVPTRDVLAEFETLARTSIEGALGVAFRVAPAPADLRVYCDVGQLENALLNLVLNSRDAIIGSGRGDTITVSVRSVPNIGRDAARLRESHDSYGADTFNESDAADRNRADGRARRYVEFSVTDNGPGMTAEVKRRAVDPFFTTKDAEAGTGLGLSMVYGFVQQSGGELRIYSELGHGTTIRIVLPRGNETGTREDPVDREDLPKGSGERVLVVEDDPQLLDVTADLIARLGCAPVPAASGRAALELIDAGTEIDLMLTDVVMPGGVGGFELAAELRKRRADVPVVYMSGYSTISDSDMGAVVAPILQKPCDPAELARTLLRQLQAAD
ncbi:PAS domain S-box protein [Rhodobacterales bacterium HKCCE3408]|nr:PAS domain S-box protein [Rhodobacterales bacterium HKCCE3408]